MTTEPTWNTSANEQARIERSVAARIAYEKRVMGKAAAATDTIMGILRERFDAVAHTAPDCEIEFAGETGTCACGALEDVNIRDIFEEMLVSGTER